MDINHNPEFHEGAIRVEFTLMRKMILTMFFHHVDQQPNPRQYYRDFLDEWEGIISEDIATQLRKIDENKKKSFFHQMFYDVNGFGDTSGAAEVAQEVITQVKKHYGKYYN